MAEKNYKVGEAVSLGYQAPNKESGLVIIAEIYLPDKTKDIVNFPDVTLVEVGSSGTYRDEFSPDVEGTWQVITHKAGGDGQVVKNYSVGAHNVHSVGDLVAAVDNKIDVVDGKVVALDIKVSALDTPPMAF